MHHKIIQCKKLRACFEKLSTCSKNRRKRNYLQSSRMFTKMKTSSKLKAGWIILKFHEECLEVEYQGSKFTRKKKSSYAVRRCQDSFLGELYYDSPVIITGSKPISITWVCIWSKYVWWHQLWNLGNTYWNHHSFHDLLRSKKAVECHYLDPMWRSYPGALLLQTSCSLTVQLCSQVVMGYSYVQKVLGINESTSKWTSQHLLKSHS